MKYRKDFVTNSSSSSFIVMCKNDTFVEVYDHINQPYVLGEQEKIEFSRGYWRIYQNVHTKINFLAINCLYHPEKTIWKENLECILKKHLHCSSIDWSFLKRLEDDDEAYIDHQSVIDEHSEYAALLEDLDICERFLFGDQSVLYFGGDEYDPSDAQKEKVATYFSDSSYQMIPETIMYLFK